MVDDIQSFLSQQAGNEFFAGGLLLGLLGVLVAYARGMGPVTLRALRNQFLTTVTIDNRSPIFRYLLAWFNEHPYMRDCRRVTVNKVGEDDQWSDTINSDLLFSPACGTHFIRHGSNVIWLTRKQTSDKIEDGFTRSASALETITLTAFDPGRRLIKSILEEATQRFCGNDPDKMNVYCLGIHLDWRKAAKTRKRAIGSVVLKDNTGKQILSDAKWFLKNQEWYVARGIPWRRGYLLSGAPGTGKTSLIKAIVGELDMGVANLSLASDRLTDNVLLDLLSQTPANCAIVLEDIDAAFRGRQQNDAAKGVTFSGLLNAIDGIGSPEGQLLFMSSNHPDELDPALVRPGRVDRHLHLELAGPTEAKKLFLTFFPGEFQAANELATKIDGASVSPATLQGCFLLNPDRPADVIDEITRSLKREAP